MRKRNSLIACIHCHQFLNGLRESLVAEMQANEITTTPRTAATTIVEPTICLASMRWIGVGKSSGKGGKKKVEKLSA